MTSDAALNLNFNIIIKILDKNGKIVKTKKVHNKATQNMVSSIIQFLQGVFNPSEFNDPYEKYANPEQAIINNAYGAKKYIPSCTGAGICGVSTSSHELSINSEEQVKPNFYEDSLQEEVDAPRLKFRRVRPTRGSDLNNSEGLSLMTVLPRGYLLYTFDDNGEVIYDQNNEPVLTDNYFWYYGESGDSSESDKKKAVAITEIGLFSNTSKEDGLLLARVLLDGELSSTEALAKKGVMANPDYDYNPLIQTEDTSVVIEWKIGIISIGTNDNISIVMDDDTPVEDITG